MKQTCPSSFTTICYSLPVLKTPLGSQCESTSDKEQQMPDLIRNNDSLEQDIKYLFRCHNAVLEDISFDAQDVGSVDYTLPSICYIEDLQGQESGIHTAE